MSDPNASLARMGRIARFLHISDVHLGAFAEDAVRRQDVADAFARALEMALRPDHPSAHFHLGNAYYAKMWWEEAMVEYERVFHLDPGHIDVHFALGGIYLNRGYQEKAVECWQKYLELAPADSPKAKLAKDYVAGTTANKVHIGKYIAE